MLKFIITLLNGVNMISVKEYKHSNEIYFCVTGSDENNKTLFSNDIYYRAIYKEIDNKTYFILYNKYMEPISEVFQFLNSKRNSFNTILSSLQALKLLYNYQDIIGKKLNKFSIREINNLKLFLKGVSTKGKSLSLELSTNRNNRTINGYLSVYRSYLNFLGEENKFLSMKTNRKTIILDPFNEIKCTVESYEMNEKVPKRPVEIPFYIDVNDFWKIILEVRKNFNKMEEIIIRLMYQCGLRIGEVLGLTGDDLIVEQVEDDFYPVAYLRNRVSDKNYQYAKSCMTIFDKSEYQTADYKIKGYGFQKIFLPQDLYDLINEYIEEAHTHARINYEKNYFENTIADRVRKSKKYEDINYYVFINSLGVRLTYKLWNTKIRKIFKAVGLHLDVISREHNLNHRFRHGFAMYNVQYLKCGQLELQMKLRHSTPLSTYCYYKPTISDQIELKTNFANSLYELIPELNRGGL